MTNTAIKCPTQATNYSIGFTTEQRPSKRVKQCQPSLSDSTLAADLSHVQQHAPKKPVTLTPFTRLVYAATCRIPSGQLSTYKLIAASIGQPKAVRAVGTALKNNPFCPIVPCHRVVASNGTIGGFSGSKGVDNENVKRKIRILQAEGIQFEPFESAPGVILKDEHYRRKTIINVGSDFRPEELSESRFLSER